MKNTAEQQRLDGEINWKQWGPYLSERAWGTVREDYSPSGSAWDYFSHDHARSRAYRWNEDGLAGISDDQQYLCFALALWNGEDPILKERMYGLTGPEGNHGEDVKEYYFYLDSTPTHSYMKMLYKYPQRAFPYADLIHENQRRGYDDLEYELLDTGAFANNRYFDVTVEYAKNTPQDVLIQITVTNRGDEDAECTVLPHLWFRNTWSWGYPTGPLKEITYKPRLRQLSPSSIETDHPVLGHYTLYADMPEFMLFTENNTNTERLYGVPNAVPYVKDAFHRYLIQEEAGAINSQTEGTKTAIVYSRRVKAGESWIIRLRLVKGRLDMPFASFDTLVQQRQQEADSFYASLQNPQLSLEERAVQRQALAGMLWTKQFFYYDVEQWINGDPGTPAPAERHQGRNHEWLHLNNADIVIPCDKWEYPWYAAWDLSFQCPPIALVDPGFAKSQLLLLTREWYMHPNGQFPAYEWAFGDVNPPVQAWAALHVYQLDAVKTGKPDTVFLKRMFHKLLLNFTWWVNRKDMDGRNIFQGGFLGMDNISLFDRSAILPTGGHLNQSDGTAWMGFYCLSMLNMAIELAKEDTSYQDMAVKFYEHFLSIALAISGVNENGVGLWDEEDGFFYDVLNLPDGTIFPLKVRSLVGLMPLVAVGTVSQSNLERMPEFARSLKWIKEHRPHLTSNMASVEVEGGNTILFAIPTRERLLRVLRYMLDESEFLSEYGIRSISKFYASNPYTINIGGQTFSIEYLPAESRNGLFGGNSNWRGPIWFPINYLLIQALYQYHEYYGSTLEVEYPTGAGTCYNLKHIADDLSHRMSRLFLKNEQDQRPVYGAQAVFQSDPHWRDYMLFYEYFHGDNGAGLGASHQTGWTGLIANLMQDMAGSERK